MRNHHPTRRRERKPEKANTTKNLIRVPVVGDAKFGRSGCIKKITGGTVACEQKAGNSRKKKVLTGTSIFRAATGIARNVSGGIGERNEMGPKKCFVKGGARTPSYGRSQDGS